MVLNGSLKYALCAALTGALVAITNAESALAQTSDSGQPDLSLYRCQPSEDNSGWTCAALTEAPSANLASGLPRSPKPSAPRSKDSTKANSRPIAQLAETQSLQAAELDWRPIETLSPEQRTRNCVLCQGQFIAPAVATAEPNDSDDIRASADQSESTATGSILTGNVRLTQADREIRADQISIESDSDTLDLTGNIQIREPGLLLVGSSAVMARANQSALLSDASFVLHEQGLHGSAKTLQQASDGRVTINGGSLSYCAPDDETWAIHADQFVVDTNSGMGTADGAQLRVKDTTVLLLPRFSFPVGDQRKSGLLWPSISNDSVNGATISQPFYLNLAPNYDLLYTPTLLQERGLHQQLAMRYLGQRGDEWAAEIGYLDNDNLGTAGQAAGNNRWHLALDQEAQYNDYWSSSLTIDAVSDPNYLRDIDASKITSRYQDQLAKEGYLQFETEHLSARLAARKLDALALDFENGYAIEPQLDLRYRAQEGMLQPILATQYTQFSHQDPTQLQGSRWYSEAGLGLQKRWQSGFIRLQGSRQSLRYSFDSGSIQRPDHDTNSGQRWVLDGSIVLDHESGHTSLQPRMYYVHSDEERSLETPLFDTKAYAITTRSWLRDRLVSSNDRLSQEHRVTLALDLDHTTAEWQLQGQLAYLKLLDPLDASSVSAQPLYRGTDFIGLHAKATWEPGLSASLDLVGDAESGDVLNQFAHLQWRNTDDSSFALGYSKNVHRRNTEQWHLSSAYRLRDNLRFLIAANVDTRHNAPLEALVGLEYESCCVRVRVVHSQYESAPNGFYFQDESNWRTEQQTQIEVSLKGLGGFGQSIDATLNELIRGFNETSY